MDVHVDGPRDRFRSEKNNRLAIGVHQPAIGFAHGGGDETVADESSVQEKVCHLFDERLSAGGAT